MTLTGKRPPNRDPELQRTELVQDTKALMVQDTKTVTVFVGPVSQANNAGALLHSYSYSCLDEATSPLLCLHFRPFRQFRKSQSDHPICHAVALSCFEHRHCTHTHRGRDQQPTYVTVTSES